MSENHSNQSSEVEIWTIDTIEILLGHLYRPTSSSTIRKGGDKLKSEPNTVDSSAPTVSNSSPLRVGKKFFFIKKAVPEDIYPEPLNNVVKTFCVKFPPHAHGDYLISEHVFHEHCNLGPGWKGFYQVNRRKYKPVKFKQCYYVDMNNIAKDSIWIYAQEIINTYNRQENDDDKIG